MFEVVLKSWYSVLLSFISPLCCCSCGEHIENDEKNSNLSRFLCQNCFDNTKQIQKCCKKCGYPVLEEYSDVFGNKIVNKDMDNITIIKKSDYNYCPSCENKKRYFDIARSCYEYKGCIRHIILMLKYYHKTDCFDFIAEKMYQKYTDMLLADYICFVPITRKKLFIKGFNHAGIIANALYKQLKTKSIKKPEIIYDLFIKQTKTKQAKELSRSQRITTKHSFMINKKYLQGNINFNGKFNGKTFLIIDDIMTTGGTLNELSKLLKCEFKNCKVECLTFARTMLY